MGGCGSWTPIYYICYEPKALFFTFIVFTHVSLTINRYEWLVDAYCMRLDDMFAFHGNCFGQYDPKRTAATILEHFLVFVKLAVRRGVIPPSTVDPEISTWSWEDFLSKETCADRLRAGFKTADAIKKYGTAAASFEAPKNGRSLRATGRAIYSLDVKVVDKDVVNEAVKEGIEKAWPRLFASAAPGNKMDTSAAEELGTFEDVGGAAVWGQLYSDLVAAGEKPGRIPQQRLKE